MIDVSLLFAHQLSGRRVSKRVFFRPAEADAEIDVNFQKFAEDIKCGCNAQIEAWHIVKLEV